MRRPVTFSCGNSKSAASWTENDVLLRRMLSIRRPNYIAGGIVKISFISVLDIKYFSAVSARCHSLPVVTVVIILLFFRFDLDDFSTMLDNWKSFLQR